MRLTERQSLPIYGGRICMIRSSILGMTWSNSTSTTNHSAPCAIRKPPSSTIRCGKTELDSANSCWIRSERRIANPRSTCSSATSIRPTLNQTRLQKSDDWEFQPLSVLPTKPPRFDLTTIAWSFRRRILESIQRIQTPARRSRRAQLASPLDPRQASDPPRHLRHELVEVLHPRTTRRRNGRPRLPFRFWNPVRNPPHVRRTNHRRVLHQN